MTESESKVEFQKITNAKLKIFSELSEEGKLEKF